MRASIHRNKGKPTKAKNHSAFGMWQENTEIGDVQKYVRTLRKKRYILGGTHVKSGALHG